MKLEINKEWVDEAVQKAVDEIKQNFVPLSVIEDIKAEIETMADLSAKTHDMTLFGGLELALGIIDKHISGAEKTETCTGCTHPCVMYEPTMKACEKKGR